MADENALNIDPETFTIPFDAEGQMQLFKLLIKGFQELNDRHSRLSAAHNKLIQRVNDLEEAVVDQSEVLCLHDSRSRSAMIVKDCPRKPRLYQKVDDGIELVKKIT